MLLLPDPVRFDPKDKSFLQQYCVYAPTVSSALFTFILGSHHSPPGWFLPPSSPLLQLIQLLAAQVFARSVPSARHCLLPCIFPRLGPRRPAGISFHNLFSGKKICALAHLGRISRPICFCCFLSLSLVPFCCFCNKEKKFNFERYRNEDRQSERQKQGRETQRETEGEGGRCRTMETSSAARSPSEPQR